MSDTPKEQTSYRLLSFRAGEEGTAWPPPSMFTSHDEAPTWASFEEMVAWAADYPPHQVYPITSDLLAAVIQRVAIAESSLTTDRTALATLREAVRAVLDADDALLASTNGEAMAEASNDLDQTLAALRALTADHEEGGT